jgi:tRNA 2-selenouridine synthase
MDQFFSGEQNFAAIRLSVRDFLARRNAGNPVIDVRSPAEFRQGHIPGALHIPLFTDEERATIGTLYSRSGKEDAVAKGLEIIGPKLKDFARKGLSIEENRDILLYCWRGGMRSASMAWLFETIGRKAFMLEGGYKSYRRYIHDYLSLPFHFIIIGGLTGSGKTELLTELEKSGHPVVNLEKIASHKGSVFGSIGEKEQPTTEQFENMLYENMSSFDQNISIFIEDESISIGSVFLPKPFHDRMLLCPLVIINVPYEDRIKRLVALYTSVDADILISAVEKIEKRLGSEDTQKVTGCIRQQNYEEAIFTVLKYYDKVYYRTMQSHFKEKKIITLDFNESSMPENAKYLADCLKTEKLIP